VVSERLKIRGSLARKGLKELLAKGKLVLFTVDKSEFVVILKRILVGNLTLLLKKILNTKCQ